MATGPLGALGQFGDRYGDTVKVYTMKDPKSPKDERPFSFEICGGPHVDHTLQLFEDGKKFKSLKRHLRTEYDMSPEEYRAKWGLPPDYPMVAPTYSEARSRLAKTIGLGRKPKSSSSRSRAKVVA